MAISSDQRKRLDSLESALGKTKKGTPEYDAARNRVLDYRTSIGVRAGNTGKGGSGGGLLGIPGDLSKQLGKSAINNPTGALTGQLGLNQFIAGQNFGLNNPNEDTPFGSMTNYLDENGNAVRRSSLSPGQAAINSYQELLDKKNLEGQIYKRDQASATLQDPYSLSGVRSGLSEEDLMGGRRRVEDNLFNSWNSRMQPQFEQDRAALEQRLSDQGLARDSVGWQNAFKQQAQNQNDARQQALSGASAQGLGEYNSMFGNSLQARNQGIQEYEAGRYAPINEMGMLGQGVRGVMQPNFTGFSGSQVGSPDIAGTYLGYGGLDINKGQLGVQQGQLGLQQQQFNWQKSQPRGGGASGPSGYDRFQNGVNNYNQLRSQ